MTRLLGFAAVAASFAWSAPSAWAGEFAEGDEAPAFSLAGSDGQTHALEDYRDKQVVVIAWFPKAFTGG